MLLYRTLLTILAIPLILWLVFRVLLGRESFADLRERFAGNGPETPTHRPTIWLHGASNGELTSARGLINRLLEQDESLTLVVTANTTSGRDMIAGWNTPRIAARLAPLDLRVVLARFRATWSPDAFVLLEGDLWPNRILTSPASGTPLAIVSARISERSARKWARLPGLATAMFSRLSLLSPQDDGSAQRFLDLGLPRENLLPTMTLKSSVDLAPPPSDQLHEFQSALDRKDTFLAASTHPGEEEQVIEAFKIAREKRARLRMILAPRHPRRGGEVAELLAKSGLTFAQRSKSEDFGSGRLVYLADTLGEMPLWYALSAQCFVGGSLVPKGGHTPYEPAQFDCAILHGPDTSNFKPQYEALNDLGGALRVSNAASLGNALGQLGQTRQSELAERARTALALDAQATGLNELAQEILALTGG